jgi:hypothetical protein
MHTLVWKIIGPGPVPAVGRNLNDFGPAAGLPRVYVEPGLDRSPFAATIPWLLAPSDVRIAASTLGSNNFVALLGSADYTAGFIAALQPQRARFVIATVEPDGTIGAPEAVHVATVRGTPRPDRLAFSGGLDDPRAERLSNLRAPRPARLPNPKPTTINLKGSRYERGTTGGQVRRCNRAGSHGRCG